MTRPRHRISAGTPATLGAEWDGEGVNFAVFSEHATKIELCLFSPDGRREQARLPLPERSGPVWHGYVRDLQPGAIYGLRAHGDYDPERGHRFNPNKLLLDPYARRLAGSWQADDALLGFVAGAPAGDLSFDRRDSAPFVAKAVVTVPPDAFPAHERPATPWAETVIYEAHAKGLTKLRHDVDEALRGTYAGLAAEPVLDHLVRLGVTAVELLPVHAIFDDLFLVKRGLRNYWGYNSIGFFVPEPRYQGPAGFADFRDMVRRFHAAGIEVILDVVYNHSGEGNHLGPTLSFRGLDNASYYRLLPDDPRYYVDDTGCGNTLNLAHPFVLRLVLDSLRYWVEVMGVDGFRFDLATTLAREEHGFAADGGFLDALRQDPVLRQVKLIAEPWDVGPGGYRLGQFPPGFAEWNDEFRDTLRRYWRGDRHGAHALADRLLGSAGRFDRDGRRAWASINFVTAHDGFPLRDLVSFDRKHNEANGEDNLDGQDENYSDNCGVEGDSDDPDVLECRARRRRNMLTTLMLAQGTPMLLAGDEIGHSQRGNNNAYCQDNEIAWIDWSQADTALLDFVARLSAFRREHPCLRQTRFLHGAVRPEDGEPDVEWRAMNGGPLDWEDPELRQLCLLVRGAAEAAEHDRTDDAVFIAINGGDTEAQASLPAAPDGSAWLRALDSAAPDAEARACAPGVSERIAERSVVAFAVVGWAGLP